MGFPFSRRSSHAPSMVSFQRVLVPIAGNEADEIALRVAALALGGAHGQASLLHVIEVPFQRQLDVQDERAIGRANEILQRGEALMRELKTDVRTSMVQARSAGAAIVDEAVEIDAELIVMGLPYKRRFGGRWDTGDAVPYVMRNSSAPVWCLRTRTEEVADT